MELRLISLLGWLTMIAAAWAISYNRKLFPWRTVAWGIGLQFALALIILKTPWGKDLFEVAGKIVQKLIQFSNDGTKFVFGPLADQDLMAAKFGPEHSLVFAIVVMGTIIIVACISSLLYHWAFCKKSSTPSPGACAKSWVRAAAKRSPPARTFSWAKPKRR